MDVAGGALCLPASKSTLSILVTSSSTLATMPVAMSRGVPELAIKNIEGTGTTLSERQRQSAVRKGSRVREFNSPVLVLLI